MPRSSSSCCRTATAWTHRALLEQVWGPAYVHDTQSLRTHIANLRRKIEPARGLRLIRTDHGVGYRLAAPAGGY